MRLLQILPNGDFRLTKKLLNDAIPSYAILSHRWKDDSQEVTFEDMAEGTGQGKAGYEKIKFCGEQAARDGLQYFWMDSCCIKKSSDAELSESLNSMFRWYQRAEKCYVYLSDGPTRKRDGRDENIQDIWEQAFRESDWFTRGWTLQELLAPSLVEFFSPEKDLLGSKQSLEKQIHAITGIPISALRGSPLSQFSINEKFDWAKNRQTTREEDWAYSLLGIFEISMPVIYGEGRTNAVRRLRKEIDDASKDRECLRHLNVTEPYQICQTDEVTPFSRHYLDSFVSTLVQQTQHAFLLTDFPWQRHLAHLYGKLAEHHTLLRELQISIENRAVSRDERPTTCLDCGKRFSKGWGNCRTQLDEADQLDSTAADIFFDCTSRFSRNTSTASINRLSTNFTGSPAYTLERHTSSHPQLYTMEGLFSNPLFVLAMKQIYNQDQLTHQYYLLYAQTPRCWQRVIVSATFGNFQDVSAIPLVSAPDDDDFTCKILPDAVNAILHTELPRMELFSSVTRISLYLDEGGAGKKIWKVPQIKAVEDCLEIEMSKEDEILRDIEVMSLHQFSESKIEVTSQISSSRFTVKLDSQVCVNRKIPFASAGSDGDNGLHDFIKDLKLLNSVQDCHGIPRLIGVVFDDAHIRLKGYLHEAPMIRELIRVFYVANSRSETIPWSIRVLWSKQIAQAMAEIHKKGLTIGVLSRNNIGLRADGSPVLTHLTASRRYLHHEKESLPPELQSPHGNAPQQSFNDRTDIFQLGLLLWLLAEHKGNTDGVRCSRYVCTNIPRYQCTADHANPANLPPCLGSVPSYFSDIITQCRSPNPNARPTARRIAEILSSQCEFEGFPRDSLKVLKTYNDNIRFGAHCMECGVPALYRHFHCYACDFGDFDLCPDCVDMGIHCRVLEHQLVERTSKDGGFIHAS
jgi:serine/threonine protein kinase